MAFAKETGMEVTAEEISVALKEKGVELSSPALYQLRDSLIAADNSELKDAVTGGTTSWEETQQILAVQKAVIEAIIKITS